MLRRMMQRSSSGISQYSRSSLIVLSHEPYRPKLVQELAAKFLLQSRWFALATRKASISALRIYSLVCCHVKYVPVCLLSHSANIAGSDLNLNEVMDLTSSKRPVIVFFEGSSSAKKDRDRVRRKHGSCQNKSRFTV